MLRLSEFCGIILSEMKVNLRFMNYLEHQVEILRTQIDNGELEVDSPLVCEQKDRIIDHIYDMHLALNVVVDKTTIGAVVDKVFAEELDVD